MKSYKEKFYNPASHFEEYPQLTRAFQAVLDDFKGILNADDNFIIEKLNEDLDKLNKEVTSLQPTPIPFHGHGHQLSRGFDGFYAI